MGAIKANERYPWDFYFHKIQETLAGKPVEEQAGILAADRERLRVIPGVGLFLITREDLIREKAEAAQAAKQARETVKSLAKN